MSKYTLYLVIGQALLLCGSAQGQDESVDARTVLEKHVEMLNANTPVCGEFRIDNSKGTIQRFKWAIDANRERLEPIEGKGHMVNFLVIGDTIMEGASKSSYSFRKPNQVGMVRPGDFGIFDASGARWSTYLDGSKPDCKMSCVRRGREYHLNIKGGEPYPRYVLVLDTTSYRRKKLYSYDYKSDKLFCECTVTDYYHDPITKKSFPSKGLIELTHPETGKIFSKRTLEILSIRFPTDPEEIEKCFDMVIEKYALIHDAIYDKVVRVNANTNARDFFEKPTSLKHIKVVRTVSRLDRMTNNLTAGIDWRLILSVTVIMSASAFVCYLFYQRRNANRD